MLFVDTGMRQCFVYDICTHAYIAPDDKPIGWDRVPENANYVAETGIHPMLTAAAAAVWVHILATCAERSIACLLQQIPHTTYHMPHARIGCVAISIPARCR